MDIFDNLRIRLYTEAIQYCQHSFSARMQIPGRGVAFVQRIDQVHEPMEAELRDGLVKIQQAYDRTMSLYLYDLMAVGGGIGALLGGIACAVAGPIGWVWGGLIIIGGGASAGTVLTVQVSKTRFLALQALFRREIEFVTLNIPAINYHMSQHPEDNWQVEPLRTHFNWVVERPESIEKEFKEAELEYERERTAFNRRQESERQSYRATHGYFSAGDAAMLYPKRDF